MSDFDTQINVGMNVEGVVTGTEKAKRSLKDLNTSARESGKSIDGMGDGGSKAADKVEAATRSMIGSIQRQTAALEAGDKSSRKYQESLAKMRGIDVGALKPYLDQLDAAKMKQDIAANSQKGLIGGFGGISTAALGAATAFVAVAAGVATMTKKVVDGLDALNDLKDATGASIENISAIEDVALRTGASFDVVSTSLIKLNQGLNSAKPGSDTENAIKAIGLSVNDLKELDPAEAFRQIAIGLSSFADDANKARLTQELFGKSLKEVAPLLNDLAASGELVATVTAKQAEEAEKFNKELAQLSKSSLDAARDMAGPLVSAINETIAMFREGAKEGKSFYTVLVNEQLRLLGLKDGPKEYAARLNDISRELESGNIHQTKRNALLREQAAIQSKLAATPVANYDESELARLARAPKPSIGNLPDQAAIKAAAAASQKALAEQNKELAAQAKLIAETAGLTGSFSEDWSRLADIYKKGGYNLSQLTDAQEKLLASQPAVKAFRDAEKKDAELIEKANKAAYESKQKSIEILESGIGKLEAEVSKQSEYNERIGLTKEAIAELDAAKLELQATDIESIAIKKLDRDLDEEQYDLYKKQATELRNLARLKRVGVSKESEIEAGKAAAAATTAEWKRGWEETDRLARDVFTTWATDGSNAAQKIGDTLKKALLSAIYEATIKPIAFQLYTSIAGNGGAAGAVQAASGAGNALSGGSSLLSGLSSVTGAFGSSLSANFGATMSSFGSTIGLSIEGGLASIAEGTAASVASGLGSIAGALGPVAVGIGALSALKSAMDYKVEANGSALVANLGGGPTVVANRNDYTQTGGLFGGGTTQNSEWSAASAELTAYMDAQVKLVTESARAYGTALGLPVADLDSFKQQIEVSLTGLNADQAKEAINKAIGGFGDALVSANFGPALDGLKRSGETSSATLVRVASQLTTVNGTLGMLGGKLLSVDAAGIKAADGLVQAMGGLEAFQQQTASYYSQYYSQEEQRMQTALSIQARLAQGGIDVSIEQVLNGTREQFRALVDSFKDGGGLMDEAGQKAVAALMAVAGAFAGITTASANVSASSAEAAATESSFGAGVGTSGPSQSGWSGPGGPDGASEAANAILQERKTLQDELDNLTMTSTELLEKQRNALDESNRALFDQIQVAKEAARVAEQNKSLQDEYNQLTMTSAQLRALEREQIAEANLELFDRITALKAEQEAITTANNAVDAALAGVQRAIDAEKKSIEAARQAAQERAGILKSIVDSVTGAIDNLRGNVGSTKAQAAREANAFIDNALTNAKATGYLPDPDDLKDAISKATGGIDREGLSQFEYERAQLVLAGKLEGLKAVASPQLTAAQEAVKVAEAQLKALDDQLAAAQESINVLRGIDTSVLSVAEAIERLQAAILGVYASGGGGETTPTPGVELPNIGGVNQNGLSYAGIKTQAINLANWYGTDTVGAGTALYNVATRYGYTSDDLDKAMGWTSGHALQWALSNGLAAFDVGTDYVPKTGIAMIHEGEAIIPKAYNPAAGGQSGNARLESLVEGLTKEVQRLQAIVNDGNKSNQRTADAVNGRPEMPMLVETVT